MPQPLSRVAPNANYEIGLVPLIVLRNNPQLAVLAMEAIASWSNFEAFMLNVYVQLAGGEHADAAALYLSLETTSAKSAAIATLARRKLKPEYVELLQAITKISKSVYKERNKLAHWQWGSSVNVPDAALLADPKDLVTRDHNDLSIFYVYKAEDFLDITNRCIWLSDKAYSFFFLLRAGSERAAQRYYDELLAVPEIAEILHRRREQG